MTLCRKSDTVVTTKVKSEDLSLVDVDGQLCEKATRGGSVSIMPVDVLLKNKQKQIILAKECPDE